MDEECVSFGYKRILGLAWIERDIQTRLMDSLQNGHTDNIHFISTKQYWAVDNQLHRL